MEETEEERTPTDQSPTQPLPRPEAVASAEQPPTSVIPAASGGIAPEVRRVAPGVWVAVGLLAAFVLAAGVWLIFFDDQPAMVPDLIGMTVSRATTDIEEAGLVLGELTEQIANETSGTVIAQTPAAGTEVDSGTAVALVVAVGADTELEAEAEDETGMDSEPEPDPEPVLEPEPEPEPVPEPEPEPEPEP
ncbi:MAG: PASTA domain-containing protein, partial [Coriobacteriia bacterium]|nr:PASTA domain-containing protein [Coriobacteriia bacterium]